MTTDLSDNKTMNFCTIQVISKLRNKSQSELARVAGVSRQAVSQWFKSTAHSEVNLRSVHLRRLAEGLHVSADVLLKPLPVLSDNDQTREYEGMLLWDRLYPSLADYSVALLRGELPALARLVQVFGLFRGEKIAGSQMIWNRFPNYKHLIRSVRRQQMERIWNLHNRLSSK